LMRKRDTVSRVGFLVGVFMLTLIHRECGTTLAL
jgi:hypothetical protein